MTTLLPRPMTTAACTASLGLALALGAPVAAAQDGGTPTDSRSLSIGSVGGTSVGVAEKVGLGAAAGSLPGQCSAMGSVGFGDHNQTRAVPGENPGETAFLVDTNKPSEGSTTTENVEVHWVNTDTGAKGTLVEGHGEDDIHWVEFNGDDVWGAIVDTGPGTIEWTMSATEDGLFLPTFSLDLLIPTGSGSNPYGGCGGVVTVP